MQLVVAYIAKGCGNIQYGFGIFGIGIYVYAGVLSSEVILFIPEKEDEQ
jgi:hypothetical protein